MATFKIAVQKQRNDGYWPVYIRVTHRRRISYIKTDKMVNDKGLVKSTNEVKDPYVRKYCDNLIVDYVEKLNKVDTSKWNIEDVIHFLKSGSADICFSDYARQ